MALTECPECGKLISEQASICPNCGFRLLRYKAKKTYQKIFNLQHIKSQIESTSDKIYDIPVIGSLLWGISVAIIALLSCIMVYGVPMFIIFTLFTDNAVLGCIAFDVFLIAINYFVWYKDRKWKFWFSSVLTIVLTISLAYIVNA